jgi:5-methylcytosine-specific restriction endonuclease McrA
MPRPRKPDPAKHCMACGTLMARKTINGRLEDRTVFLKRRYCDRACMATGYVSATAQPNSKRRRVSKFRGTSCESCGATTRLHAHHIDGNVNNDSPSNIQTLCASCHVTHHHRARRAGLTVPGRAG